jgi:hypothetical protein
MKDKSTKMIILEKQTNTSETWIKTKQRDDQYQTSKIFEWKQVFQEGQHLKIFYENSWDQSYMNQSLPF